MSDFWLLGDKVRIDEAMSKVGGQVAELLERVPTIHGPEGEYLYRVRLDNGYDGWWIESKHLTRAEEKA